jgi:hypothetical protein
MKEKVAEIAFSVEKINIFEIKPNLKYIARR